MRAEHYDRLVEDLEQELLAGARSVAILGMSRVTLRLLASPALKGRTTTVYDQDLVVHDVHPPAGSSLQPFKALAESHHDLLVVASDARKEELLLDAVPYIYGAPKVLVAGYEHLDFRDPTFYGELNQLLVPSLANGYPNSLVHLYQCMVNSARLHLSGVVAEFGMHKGGTTMFLSRIAERIGVDWQVIGFDTFGGFPPRRSPLDMYDHPDCVFTDLAAVRRYLQGRKIEIVSGDIVETCHRLESEDLVLTFMDTDNYSPATAALEIVRERTLVGGAIVFDHFTGTDRFRYTLGERIAAKTLLEDTRYFNLHGTGVFYRQR